MDLSKHLVIFLTKMFSMMIAYVTQISKESKSRSAQNVTDLAKTLFGDPALNLYLKFLNMFGENLSHSLGPIKDTVSTINLSTWYATVIFYLIPQILSYILLYLFLIM